MNKQPVVEPEDDTDDQDEDDDEQEDDYMPYISPEMVDDHPLSTVEHPEKYT
jgi:hypothetical protein